MATVTRPTSTLERHPVVSPDEWLAARKALLAKEKEFTRLRDSLSEQRRELPWVKIDKQYVFDGPNGPETLADLFEGRSQLVIYHFMFAPNAKQGCSGCSFWADNFNGIGVHLNHRDVTLAAISRAPLAQIDPFKERMGWSFKWVSSGETDFNYDFDVSFRPEDRERGTTFYNYQIMSVSQDDMPGISVFYKDAAGDVFHTYSSYLRGIDLMNTAYNYLDLVPKGRDEAGLPHSMAWLRHHDRYED